MSRGLSRGQRNVTTTASGAALVAVLLAAAAFVPVQAVDRSDTLERFLALDDPDPTQYRALRHLEARNEQFGKSATMDVWTEGDENGFRYRIVSEEGSEYIRNRVFKQTLETERRMWASGAPSSAALTPANYVFSEN